MKAVILAGGLWTRLAEETHLRPKPMVEIGGKPILWHILKIYSHHGINDFIVCCGYKGYVIKEYFANYFLYTSDVTFHMDLNHMEVHRQKAEPWKVTLVDTGDATLTGGRLARVRSFLPEDEPFCFTYGDGVADVDITAVQPPGRYGALRLEGDAVADFQEKPDGDNAWINGGFWQPMDTLRDRQQLEDLWSGRAVGSPGSSGGATGADHHRQGVPPQQVALRLPGERSPRWP